MKKMMLVGLLLSLAAPAFAADEERKMTTGLDFAMPYVLQANGASVNTRGNFNIGLDGRWWQSDSVNWGARLNFDMEKQGATRAIVLAPGAQYHFWDNTHALRPFVRGDLPVTLYGAANAVGSTKKMDVGIAAGAGVVWNLAKTTGVENLAIRYDFAMGYNFGMGDAVTVLALDIFKIGFDYRF